VNRIRIIIPLAIILVLFALITSCDKQRIVESTEVVHDIQYIELPPDTVMIHDTVYSTDSVTVHSTDTVMVHDTVVQTNTIYDTVVQTNTIYDTVTVTITDTVVQASTSTNEALAMGALQYYVDPLVFDFIYQEFQLTDGWIYYLSSYQTDFTEASEGVYDIYGYADYWASDWSGYYPLEYYYRVTYTGGDPADVNNWELGEPAASPRGVDPGIRLTTPEKQFPTGR